MQNNLGRMVKWQDPKDQGWHTGREVLEPESAFKRQEPVYRTTQGVQYTLVQESCCGTLTWVEFHLIQPWPARNEWEEDTEQQTVLNQIERNYV